MNKYFSIFCLILSNYTCSFANDAIGYSSVGGIILGKSHDIAMKKEVLNLSYKKISVYYEFVNESSKELEETIIFPLPEYTANYEFSDQYYGEPYKFLIEVNNQKVNYHTQIKALYNNEDITKTLEKIGLTEKQIAYFPLNSPFNIKVKPLTDKQLQQLLKYNFIEKSSTNDGYVPTWSIAASYIWKQTFKPNEVVKVYHEYVPFVAAGPGVSYIDKEVIKNFCMDKSFLKGMNKLSNKEYIPVFHVSYILKSANTWKNGIEDFTLNINKGSSQELVSLCFPGEFKKINSTTLQLHLTNFKPTQDLLVFYSNYIDDNTFNNPVSPIKLNK